MHGSNETDQHRCNEAMYNYNREYKIFISGILLYVIECKNAAHA